MPSGGPGAPQVSKLAANERLREYVQDRLAGVISTPAGELVPGPEVRFIGRRHGRRADRRWARSWSPEQIAGRLRIEFADDETMRVSHAPEPRKVSDTHAAERLSRCV